ncbi:MAG: M4 family metallopeptidase [Chitinophagales bacterium]|nr:M4 family metallopeptidase [Chitinophagales bacterium]
MRYISLLFTLQLCYCCWIFAAPTNSPLDKDADWIYFDSNQTTSVTNFYKQYSESLGANYRLVPLRSETDRNGMEHFWYQIQYKNIPIEYAQLIVHTKDNKVLSVNSQWVRGLQQEATPAVSDITAIEQALVSSDSYRFAWQNPDLESMLQYATQNPDATFYPTPQLVWTSPTDSRQAKDYKLCYKFNLFTEFPTQHYTTYIDAATGKEWYRRNLLHECNGEHECTANTLFDNTVNITTTFDGDTYQLSDCTRGNGIETYSAANSTNFINNRIQGNDCQLDPTAVAAHWASAQTYDYFYNQFNCNSFDGNGGKLLSWVHYGQNYNNAQWNGLWMLYGDGNPTQYRPFVALDVVAHEITHAFTQHTADLVYANEAGALNEAFSDIFACAVEHAATGSSDWTIGEQISNNQQAFRSLSNPKEYGDPDTYMGENWVNTVGCFPWSQSDYCGIHTNSGVVNHWFYLLANGGSGTNDNGYEYNLTGIGIQAAANVTYRALKYYLTPTATFLDARNATIAAANDLFGSNSSDYLQVRSAWCAVGVGTCTTNLLVTSPSTGATLNGGQTATIKWVTDNANMTSVAISYSIDNGLNWEYVIPATPNTNSYVWTIPNISTNQAKVRVSDTNNPTNMAQSGVFSIVGCGTTAYFNVANATNSNSILNICQSETLSFDNTSIGASHYEWKVNGQLVSTNYEYTHTFNDILATNWQSVTLIAYRDDCIDQYTRYIQVQPQPIAAFSYSNTGLTTQFYATQNLPDGLYHWAIQDVNSGSITTIINETQPAYTFPVAGAYQVCLTLATTCNMNSQCQTIHVTAPPIDAPATDVCAGEWINYTVTRYIGDMQLSNDSIVYIATSGGLVHFNKNSLQSQVLTSTDGLACNGITALAQRNNELLIGTNTAGLVGYNGTNFVTYPLSNNLVPFLTTNQIHIDDIAIDNAGTIWLAIFNYGLVSFDGTNWQQHNLSNQNVIQVNIDSSNHVWYTAKGLSSNAPYTLNRFNPNNNQTNSYNFDGSFLPNAQDVKHFLIDTNNNIWFVNTTTTNKSLYQFNLNTQQLTLHKQGDITDISPNEYGYVALVYGNNNQLHSYNGTNWLLQFHQSTNATYLFIDSQNTYWVSGNNLRYKLNPTASWVIANIANPNSLPNSLTNNVVATFSNEYYPAIVANNSGIWKYINNQFQSLILNGSYNATTITNDESNGLWFTMSNTSDNLVHYRPNMPLVFYQLNNVNALDIVDIQYTNDGKLWLALREDGLLQFDPNTNTTNLYPMPQINNGTGITALTIDANNRLWIGGGKGIAQLKTDNTWQFYTNANNYLLNTLPVTDLDFTLDGNLWISTQNGLVRFDGNGWTNFNNSNTPMPSSYIHELASDLYGNLYILTNSGVANLSNKGVWKNLNGFSTGLPNNDIQHILIAPHGNVFFTASNGIGLLRNTTGILPDFEVTNPIICKNTETSFNNITNDNSLTYRWLIDGVEVAGMNELSYQFLSTGKHLVSLVASNGICDNSISKAIEVRTNANDLQIAPQAISCGTSSVMLSVNNNDLQQYEWQHNNQVLANTPTVEATEMGDYVLNVTDYCGNSVTKNVVVTLDDDCVYPGDANYDGVCNHYDILTIAKAYNTTGFPRQTATIDWDAYFATDWTSEADNSTNAKHADTNGDGIVNRHDLAAIALNYGFVHDTPTTPEPAYSPVSMLPEAENFSFNNGVLSIDLSLVNMLAPDASINGRAFACSLELALTNALGQPMTAMHIDSAKVRFGTSFGNSTNSWNISRYQSTGQNRGKIDIGYIRTEGEDVDLATRKAILDVYVDDEDSFPSIDSLTLALNINVGAILSGNQFIPISQHSAALVPPTSPVKVRAKALLEGALNPTTALMTTTLNNQNLLPLSQPFNQSPWQYAGVQAVSSQLAIPNEVTDWVLLEVRDASGMAIIEQKAAWILKNGAIVDIYQPQSESIRFHFLDNNQYYRLVVRHRNHLAVISDLVQVQNNEFAYDFTQNSSAQQTWINGKWALAAGDMNADGVISVADYNYYLLQAGIINQYNAADCNLDKTVSVLDRNAYQPNAAKMGMPEIRY